MGLQRVGCDWATNTFTLIHWIDTIAYNYNHAKKKKEAWQKRLEEIQSKWWYWLCEHGEIQNNFFLSKFLYKYLFT